MCCRKVLVAVAREDLREFDENALFVGDNITIAEHLQSMPRLKNIACLLLHPLILAESVSVTNCITDLD